MRRTYYPLAVVAVWLVILAAWMLMGCTVQRRSVSVADTLLVVHHDTLREVAVKERTAYLHDTIATTITLRENGDTAKVVRYVYVERGNVVHDTVYRDAVREGHRQMVSNTHKVVEKWSVPWKAVFFAFSAVILVAVGSYWYLRK